MIRINLLPIKQDRRREAGRNQIIIGVLVLAVEMVFFVLVYMRTSAQVDEQRNKNQMVQNQVDVLEKQVQDHQAILNEIAEFEKRQESIEELQRARTGPVYLLLELSNILSKGGRPNIDHDTYQEKVQLDPTSGYDENWDFRRVWLEAFQEKDRIVQIRGQALTHEDVAEFLRRVNLSSFFVQNELISTALARPRIRYAAKALAGAEPVVDFVIKGKIKYR